jgi:hypothetical protein
MLNWKQVQVLVWSLRSKVRTAKRIATTLSAKNSLRHPSPELLLLLYRYFEDLNCPCLNQ